MKKITKAAVAAGIAALIAVACNPLLTVVDYEIDAKAGGTVKIAFLSDVHDSWYGDGQGELVDNIKKAGTDIVVFGGDLFDEQNGEKNSWALVDALANEYPCFYSIGNHETRSGKADFYKEEMVRRGVCVLSGSSRRIEVNGAALRFFGADDLDAVFSLENDCDKTAYNILLYHYPSDYPFISAGGFDLVLSGHAHGGQWRLPGLINGLYSPDEGIFPKYAGGRYDENGSVMIVSRGLYRHLFNIVVPRIFNRPELVFVTLKG